MNKLPPDFGSSTWQRLISLERYVQDVHRELRTLRAEVGLMRHEMKMLEKSIPNKPHHLSAVHCDCCGKYKPESGVRFIRCEDCLSGE